MVQIHRLVNPASGRSKLYEATSMLQACHDLQSQSCLWTANKKNRRTGLKIKNRPHFLYAMWGDPKYTESTAANKQMPPTTFANRLKSKKSQPEKIQTKKRQERKTIYKII